MFGWTIDEERSFAVLDAYFAAGGNFIDTADIYGRRGPEGMGASERIIGRWIAARGNRDRLVIATKVGMSPERPGLSVTAIREAVEDSLQRLGIERIDLYYAHQDGSGADHHCTRISKGPVAMEAINLTIGSVVFDYADYDAEHDVLYLRVGEPEPSKAEDTPDGHAIH